MRAMGLLFVVLGGGIGAGGRYLLGLWLKELLGSPDFPWWTFIVNISGAFLIGIAFGLMREGPLAPDKSWLFLVVGILGGYTTFSTFTLETLQLFEAGNYGAVLLNLLTGPVGLLAMVIGVLLIRGLPSAGGM